MPVTLSLVESAAAAIGRRRRRRRAARRRPSPAPRAARPGRRPGRDARRIRRPRRCRDRWCACRRRPTMPRLTSSPAACARSMLGRMPIAITTRSAGSVAAVGELHALDAVGAEDLLGLAVGEERDAAPVEIALQQLPGGRVELALHQRRHQMHDARPTCRAACRPQAASRPSRPPPITTARLLLRRGAPSIVLDIGDVAEGARRRAGRGPGAAARSGCEPVASSSLS